MRLLHFSPLQWKHLLVEFKTIWRATNMRNCGVSPHWTKWLLCMCVYRCYTSPPTAN